MTSKGIEPGPVKLIAGMISGEEELFRRLEKILVRKFGPVDLKSGVFAFDFTDYYREEMGLDLKRQFLAFARPIDPARLREIKLLTVALERKFLRDGRRRINLDPGYLTAGKLVLATTKNNQHRIYVGKGIFQETTLRFVKDTFQPWEWTYLDYRTGNYVGFFNQVRKLFLGDRPRSFRER